ncbi:MAG: DUF721 domain-containing protein [Paracoccaceae bacterium]
MSRTPTPRGPSPTRRMRGFEPAAGLVKDPIRAVSEKRGFAVARLLTHWPEIAGEAISRITRPVKVGYGREGFGATLTLLVASAHAPIVQMELPKLKERVNAAYGYAAIARITLTQTAATGFAEGQAEFTPAPKPAKTPDPNLIAEAAAVAAPVQDAGLRGALELLAQNVLNRRKTTEG